MVKQVNDGDFLIFLHCTAKYTQVFPISANMRTYAPYVVPFFGPFCMLRTTLFRFLALFLVILGLAKAVSAESIPLPIRQAIENLVQEEARRTGWQYSWHGSAQLERMISMCSNPIARSNAGRLWGATTVLFTCPESPSWKSYAQIHIDVSGRYPVAARTLLPGQILNTEDVVFNQGLLTGLNRLSILNDQMLLGMTVTNRVETGQPFRSDNVRAPVLIQPGQMVRIHIKGVGFSIAGEGRAIGQGVLGQSLAVKTGHGQTFNAIVRSHDLVEVNMQ
jgi:flagellar basal body P-ring formation protein FlgA